MSILWEQVTQGFGPVVRVSKRSMGAMAEGLRRQAAMQKLAGRIRALNRERSRLVRTIGKKVYSLHTRGKVDNQDVLSDCLRIDETGQEIEALHERMEGLRRQAAAGEQLVVDIEDETPLAEEVEEEPGVAELAAEQTPEPVRGDLVGDVESEAPVFEEAEAGEGAAERPKGQADLAD